MRQHILDDLALVHRLSRDEVRRADRPHHDAHGNEKDGGVEHADLAVDALGDGIAEKAAHRHDGAVFQHLFPLRIIAVKK